MNPIVNLPARREVAGRAYCPICTHTVDTTVVLGGRKPYVKPGLRCPRCSSSLDSGVVLGTTRAAA